MRRNTSWAHCKSTDNVVSAAVDADTDDDEEDDRGATETVANGMDGAAVEEAAGKADAKVASS